MRITLQIISSLLIVLGLGIAASFAVIFTMPDFDIHRDPASVVVTGLFLLLPAVAIATFRRFHEALWPASLVSTAGVLQAIGAVYCMLAGTAELVRPGIERLGGVFLLVLGLYALMGAGALIVGGILSLAAGRITRNPLDDFV